MSSARRVSPYRSRSVRPSARVPENVSAIQRMPDAASSAGTPSFTNATEKIRRQEMAKRKAWYKSRGSGLNRQVFLQHENRHFEKHASVSARSARGSARAGRRRPAHP